MPSHHESPTATSESTIENEIANYRAISPLAIISLVLGILSVLSFANWFFVSIGIAAIVTGGLASRNIRRYPDILTGQTFASAGIALALAFVGASMTTLTVTNWVRSKQASDFAKVYEDVLKKGTKDDLNWYAAAPAFRRDKTPKQVTEETTKGGREAQMAERQNFQLYLLKDKLKASPGSEIHFSHLEGHGDDGRTLYAAAVYEAHFPEAKAPDPKEQFALVGLKGERLDGKLAWYVESVLFPYQVGTHVLEPEKPVDDGHGHAGGH